MNVWGHVYFVREEKKRRSSATKSAPTSSSSAATSVLVFNLITFYVESAVSDSESVDDLEVSR